MSFEPEVRWTTPGWTWIANEVGVCAISDAVLRDLLPQNESQRPVTVKLRLEDGTVLWEPKKTSRP